MERGGVGSRLPIEFVCMSVAPLCMMGKRRRSLYQVKAICQSYIRLALYKSVAKTHLLLRGQICSRERGLLQICNLLVKFAKTTFPER